MYPPKTWVNPDYSQNLNRYVQVKDEKDKGFTISSLGIAEYEQVKNEGLYLTLFRSIGELGDWGYFPTPEAQLLGDKGEMEFDLYLDIFSEKANTSIQRALAERVPFFDVKLGKNIANQKENIIPNVDLGENLYSVLYRNDKKEAIFRAYNPDDKEKNINADGVIYNILGDKKEEKTVDKNTLDAFEIRTIKLDI